MAVKNKRSVEEKVEDFFKKQLNELGVNYFNKTDSINDPIDSALKESLSKSGGSGNNYPDIKALIETKDKRVIPIMIEAKGSKGALIKLSPNNNQIELVTTYTSDSKNSKTGEIIHAKGEPNYSAITKYAVNGAVHYANAILKYREQRYKEVIAIGINGFLNDSDDLVTEIAVYLVSSRNFYVPKKVDDFKDLSFLKCCNIDSFVKSLDELFLSEDEKLKLKKDIENTLEIKVNDIHQSLYDDKDFKTALQTNDKLYLFTGLIMACLHITGAKPLELNELKADDNPEYNDGAVIFRRIERFLGEKTNIAAKKQMVLNPLKTVFSSQTLNKPINGETLICKLFKKVRDNVMPCLIPELHIDFTGKIFNSLNDWVQIENDKSNDVVLTPHYITNFMAKLARTNKDSLVWDSAMGSAGFLISAMELMIQDAKDKIKDTEELENKISDIKQKQLLGVEILPNIYNLAVLNMILMGDGSANVLNEDSLIYNTDFRANVFLLNPPYSADGKGFCFVDRAFRSMANGYGCILIQENAGSGQGLPYTKSILENNTLVASIHMPNNVFNGKASVQVGIYLFEVNKPHDTNSLVTFIDMTEDGYARQARKKSGQEVNLRDSDHAKERYEEVLDIILNRKKKTDYYSEENGLVVKDTISLNGDDWTFNQHKKIDTMPTEEDFKKTVADYLAWKVSSILKIK